MRATEVSEFSMRSDTSDCYKKNIFLSKEGSLRNFRTEVLFNRTTKIQTIEIEAVNQLIGPEALPS